MSKMKVSKDVSSKLQKFNLLMGVIHLIQSLILFVIVDYDFKIPIVHSFLDVVGFDSRGQEIIEPVREIFWEVPVVAGVAVFLLISSIAHFVVLFIFYNTFAINMYLQYKKIGPWKDYIFGERGYIELSLVSKSALAWVIFFGTIDE